MYAGRAVGSAQLDDVAAADLEVAALVDARAERVCVAEGGGGHNAAPLWSTAVSAAPAETGRLDGIAWCLWLPPGRRARVPAVMILHGAGSRKENHADFARAATRHGFVALTFDNRGHGETEGDLGPA